MDVYCRSKGVERGAYRFLFDGFRVNPGDTPTKLAMDEMDCIDAMLFQQGGF